MENAKKKRGRPSRFRAEFAEKARTLAEFGATRVEIATFFGVDEETLRRWAAKDSAFADAIETGAARADERVRSALYQRALGFMRDEEVALSTPAGIQKITVKKVIDPDSRSAALWLANRTNFSLKSQRPVKGCGSWRAGRIGKESRSGRIQALGGGGGRKPKRRSRFLGGQHPADRGQSLGDNGAGGKARTH